MLARLGSRCWVEAPLTVAATALAAYLGLSRVSIMAVVFGTWTLLAASEIAASQEESAQAAEEAESAAEEPLVRSSGPPGRWNRWLNGRTRDAAGEVPGGAR